MKRYFFIFITTFFIFVCSYAATSTYSSWVDTTLIQSDTNTYLSIRHAATQNVTMLLIVRAHIFSQIIQGKQMTMSDMALWFPGHQLVTVLIEDTVSNATLIIDAQRTDHKTDAKGVAENNLYLRPGWHSLGLEIGEFS